MKMKKTLYFYHQEWIGFQDAQREIAVYDVKIEERTDLTAGPHIRIFLKAEEIELPDVQLLSESEVQLSLIGGLHAAKSKLQADTHLKVSAIDEQIHKLMCIENKSNDR